MLRNYGVVFAGSLAILALAACGGSHGLPYTSVPQGGMLSASRLPAGLFGAPEHVRTRSISVPAKMSLHGPELVRRKNRLRANAALTFDHIVVDGTLVTGDAAPYSVTNEMRVPVATGHSYAISMPFSNVPIHANQWVVLTFTGVAKDGSKVAIGDLAGLIDVSASSAKTTPIDVETTQTFQVFWALLDNGELSTWDLDNTPALSSELHRDITATGLKPDATTLLFTQGALQKIYDALVPKFARNLQVKTDRAGSVVLLQDYTSQPEVNLEAQYTQFSSLYVPDVVVPRTGEVMAVHDGQCGGIDVYTNYSVPPGTSVLPSEVEECEFGNLNRHSLVRNVYGGHLIAGTTADPLGGPLSIPFYSGFTRIDGRAPGTSTATISTTLNQHAIHVDDPAGVAFYYPGKTIFEVTPNFGSKPLSRTEFYSELNPNFSRVYVPAGYSAANNQVTIEGFNPFDIAPQNMQICGGINCYPVTAGRTLRFNRQLYDNGRLLTYFNWAPSGVATAIAPDGSGYGYDVTVSGAGKAVLTTNTPSALSPRQRVIISNNVTGAPWTVRAKDAAGRVYENTSDGSDTVDMDSVNTPIVTKSIALSFHAPAAGTYIVYEIDCSGCSP